MLTLTIMMETVVQTLLNFPAQEYLAIKVRQVVCPQHERPRYRIKYHTLYLTKKSRVLLLSNYQDYWYCLMNTVSLLSKFRDYCYCIICGTIA